MLLQLKRNHFILDLTGKAAQYSRAAIRNRDCQPLSDVEKARIVDLHLLATLTGDEKDRKEFATLWNALFPPRLVKTLWLSAHGGEESADEEEEGEEEEEERLVDEDEEPTDDYEDEEPADEEEEEEPADADDDEERIDEDEQLANAEEDEELADADDA